VFACQPSGTLFEVTVFTVVCDSIGNVLKNGAGFRSLSP